MGLWRGIVWFSLAMWGTASAVGQAPAPQPDVLHVTTQLVVLVATVLDKEGHIVTQALGRDDFLIEENKKPQTVYSFESTSEHTAAAASGDKEKSPELIFVLDELNYAYNFHNTSSWNVMEQFNQYTYERTELLAYLKAQPETLPEEAEVLVLTRHGYRILVQPTRDRAVLLQRVGRHDPGLGSPILSATEGPLGSLEAIWSLALQQRGLPGRKLVIWLGLGGPTLRLRMPSHQDLVKPLVERMPPAQRYQQEITDLLIDARITLDLIGPGGGGTPMNPVAVAQQMNTYLFDSDFGFAGYISATGGERMNSNDVQGRYRRRWSTGPCTTR
jgi:VWFA-related protein